MRKIELKTISTNKRAARTVILQLLVGLTVWLCMTMTASAQDWNQIIKKSASDKEASDYFGVSVAISGDYAIVGAQGEDHDVSGNNFMSKSGAAYIFKNIAGTWTEVQKIVASDRRIGDHFGASVAIQGNCIVVGALYQDYGLSGFYTNAGAAYIFENNGGTWSQVQKIVSATRKTGYSHFGSSVVIDGDYIVVGSPDYRYPSSGPVGHPVMGTGAIYVFKNIAGTWSQVQIITAIDRREGDRFGYSVDIDGDYIIAGTINDDINGNINTGSAYLYKKDQGATDNWSLIRKLIPSRLQENQYFGTSVAIRGDYAIVGANGATDSLYFSFNNYTLALQNSGAAYIFKKDQGGTDQWDEVQRVVASDRAANDNFGNSVAINGDYMVVGARKKEHLIGSIIHPNCGAAYILKDSSGTWNHIQKITPTNTSANDHFGHSVAIDGDCIITGAVYQDPGGISNAGSTYIFEKECNANNPLALVRDSTYTSFYSNTKTVGTSTKKWAHYCSEGGELLLSLDTVGTGAIVDKNQVQIKLGINKTYSYDTSGGAITNDLGYIMMERMWNVTPTSQPTKGSVGVTTYFTNEEYDSLVNEAASHTDTTTIGAVTDLEFYKGASSGFDYPHNMASGIVTKHGSKSDTIMWKYHAKGSDHSAEFKVSSLSVGGGGVGAGNLSLDFKYKMPTTVTYRVVEVSTLKYAIVMDYKGHPDYTNLTVKGGNASLMILATDKSSLSSVENRSGGSWSLSSGFPLNHKTLTKSCPRNGTPKYDAYYFNGASDVTLGSRTSATTTYHDTFFIVTMSAVRGGVIKAGGGSLSSGALDKCIGNLYDNAIIFDKDGPGGVNPYREINVEGAGKSQVKPVELINSNATALDQDWNQIIKIAAPDRGLGDEFGYSVDISGDWAVVGARWEDHDAAGANTAWDAGSVYIFKKNSKGNWIFNKKIVASDRQSNDRFGWSVAIDGDYIVVGARYEDHGIYGKKYMSKSGSAYVFKNIYGTWTQVQKIVAWGRRASDEFGYSVAISGNYIVVGARYGDYNVSGKDSLSKAGAVYVFERRGILSNKNWYSHQKIVAPDRAINDEFGYSVDIDGDYVVVGSLNDWYSMNKNSGSAHVFKKAGNSKFSHLKKLLPSKNTARQHFGNSVAIDGDYIVVGAYKNNHSRYGSGEYQGSADVFHKNKGGSNKWGQVQRLTASNAEKGDHFGSSVAISGDCIVVGASKKEQRIGSFRYPNSGAAYTFKNVTGTWSETKYFTSKDIWSYDEFGHSVAIDGDYIVVGAPFDDHDANNSNYKSKAGSAYIFENTPCNGSKPIPTASGTYLSTNSNTDDNGWTHYCSTDGELLLSLDTVGSGAVVGSNKVRLVLGTNKTYSYDTSGGTVTNSQGYTIMDRMWDVTPASQPSTGNVGVKYYFTDSEYTSLKSAAASHTNPTTIGAVTNLEFYKSAASGLNYPHHMASGNIIKNGTTPDTATWKYAKKDSDHSAEFKVSSFSGGSGGVGAGDLPLDDLPAITEVCLSSKVYLQGALYTHSNATMSDDLRVAGLIPTTEPYTHLLGFIHQGSGGGETTTPIVLATTGNDAIVDWVFLELRDTGNSSTVIETVSALVQRDGDIVSAIDGTSNVCFSNPVSDSVYVAVRHRNHLGVMAANPVQLTQSGTVVDFSTTTLYGTNGATTQNTLTALWAGDVNGDNKVLFKGANNDNSAILDRIMSAPGNTLFGGSKGYNYTNIYLSDDINMDGIIKCKGINNDQSVLLSIILNHPLNTLFGGSSGYTGLIQQLP